MFDLFFEIILYFPELFKYIFKVTGNIILYCLKYDVDLDEDSFAAYGCGIGFCLSIGLLIGLIIYY
jgi:hypothetical protein